MTVTNDDMVQVSKAELATLRKGYGLLEQLTSGENGIDVQRQLKKLDNSLNFPVIDQGDKLIAPVAEKLSATEAALAKIQEERAAELLERQNEKALSALRADIDRIATARGFSEETKGKFITFMTEKGTADPALAAPAFMETLPKPPAPLKTNGILPTRMNLFGTGDTAGEDANIAALHRDPVAWQDAEITRILNEEAA